MSIKRIVPKDGLEGLKENFTTDALSGFLVFLLAMPLSLGIAKASSFPTIFGLVSAIVGGVVVSSFMGSRLSIKGPAAGMIVIVSGSVMALGGDNVNLGWQNWILLRQQALTDMTWEDYLATFGVHVPDAGKSKPELIRYFRDWQYPSFIS